MIETQRTKLVGIAIPAEVSNPLQAALELAINESFVAGFRVVMLVCAALAAASALSALLLIEGKRSGTKQPSISPIENAAGDRR
jgi:hypothetical protein